jgi:DUF1680 family protein
VTPISLFCLALGLTLGQAPPPTVVQPVEAQGVHWTTGFWADRFENCRTTLVPAMGKLMAGTERSQFRQNFVIAAGLANGAQLGPAWNDGDYYKWLEAAAHIFAVTRDPALDEQMDDAIAVIAKAQRSDGYLHTPILIRIRNGDTSARPLQHKQQFELYNFGHLFTAAAVHHRATGKQTLLAVAIKAADFLKKAFAAPAPDVTRAAVCPAHFMGLIDLYRVTRDPTHLALARRLFELRSSVKDGTDDNQDRIPFRQQTEAVGHAVRANYLYAGAADLYAETGDRTLLGPLQTLWENVTQKKLYVTGGCGAVYDGASPEGSADQSQITRTHQAFGRNYQLPNATAHNETCASVGNLLWNERMLAITGEAKYADELERTLHNAVLAGVSLDGARFFYTNTLRQLDNMPVPLRWSRQRQPWISCFCCPPNVARTIARVHELAYGRSPGTLWVHLYGGNTLDTTLPEHGRVQLTQTTTYPWDGKVSFRLEATPAAAWGLRLRVPAWAAGATLAVNGKACSTKPAAGSYAEIRRTWMAGDTVELVLPLRTRLLQSHPLVEETRNQVAVRRGPMVYCLESVDLPAGTALASISVAKEIDWTPEPGPTALGQLTALSGKLIATDEPGWGRELYRDLPKAHSTPVSTRLIPYFAWGNRGSSEMTVWLPLRP